MRIVTKNPEMQRILDLPVRLAPTAEKAVEYAEKWTNLLQRKGVNEMPLRPIQGEALEELHHVYQQHLREPFKYGPVGQMGSVGVGHGKTLMTFLMPEVINRLRGHVRPMLIVPATLVTKTRVAHGLASRFYRYTTPEIVSMSIISHMNHSNIFERIRPTIIIIDESHQFGGDSTRTKRLQRWIVENPETILVSLSGTLTDKSITNYQHLIELTHRHSTPIPDDEFDVELWQSLLDVGGQPTSNSRVALLPLVNWHQLQVGKPRVLASGVTTETARAAYQYRMRSLPGFVGTDDVGCSASLLVRPWRVTLPPSWTAAADEFTDDGMWEKPGGEEVVEAFEASRTRAQLSSGYYTRWIWPDRDCPGPWFGEEYGTCNKTVTCLCRGTGRWDGEDHEWLHHRRAWASTERHTLKAIELKTGQDSPALIRELAKAGKLGDTARRTLAAWMEMRGRYYSAGRVEPPMEYVDMDPDAGWLAERALEWGKKNKKGIIWYASPHVGLALGRAGFKVFGRGTDLGHENPRTLKVALPCAKIDVQGTGKNMHVLREKGWHRNLALEFGGSGRRWEQMIGRTHRAGTEADEVTWDILVDGGLRSELFAAARVGAQYIQETTGTRQRLCYATYLPPIQGAYKDM
tara:strand:+ start:704 stop:2602 length:1899 start_codon:yes stop_codon:yes gene_type:complete